MDRAWPHLDVVMQAALACADCTTASGTDIPLSKGRTQVVFGAGCPSADLMFIGEAPGKDEDESGEPFAGEKVGQAGRFLDERLAELGVLRTEVYLTNVVLC